MNGSTPSGRSRSVSCADAPGRVLTLDEISALDSYQNRGWFHPLTCGGNRSDNLHRAVRIKYALADDGALTPTATQWVCLACGYTQSYEHPNVDDLIEAGKIESFYPLSAARKPEAEDTQPSEAEATS